jgi:hypothetical protein
MRQTARQPAIDYGRICLAAAHTTFPDAAIMFPMTFADIMTPVIVKSLNKLVGYLQARRQGVWV